MLNTLNICDNVVRYLVKIYLQTESLFPSFFCKKYKKFYMYHDSVVSAQENIFSYRLMAFDVHKHFFSPCTYFTLKIRTRLIFYCNFFLNEKFKGAQKCFYFGWVKKKKKESRMSCRFKPYEPHFLHYALESKGCYFDSMRRLELVKYV